MPTTTPRSLAGLEDDAYRCPSCNRPMPPAAIACGSCGFNLRTGKKSVGKSVGLQTSAAARPKLAGSAFGAIPPRRAPVMVEDRQGQLLRILIPVVLLAMVVGGIILYRSMAGRTTSVAASLKGDDARVAQLTDESGATEIHEWFRQNPQRLAGEYSPQQAIARADELQQMGAVKVLAFGSTMTRCLAVELPTNPAQRQALIAWENNFAFEHRYRPTTDVGQKYLLLDLNL